MCVIMCKASGIEFPPVDEIKNCCDSNPDGFGAMWSDGEKVRMFKTMSKEAFMKWYGVFKETMPKDVPLVIHARIATHGSKKIENCHPWLDSGKKKGAIGFCHNGILSVKNRGDLTDSETFFRDIWLPAFKSGGSKAADRATQACVGTSRFCFLFANGNVERWGLWEEGSVKGCFYTNGSWKKRQWTSFGCGGSYGGGYGGYYGRYLDDEDDVYYPSSYNKGSNALNDGSAKTLPAATTYKTPAEIRAKDKVYWLLKQDGIWRFRNLYYGEWKGRVIRYILNKTFEEALIQEEMWAEFRCPLWNLFNITVKDFDGGKPKNDDIKALCDIVEKYNTRYGLMSIKGILSIK